MDEIIDDGMLAVANTIRILAPDLALPRFVEGKANISAWVGDTNTTGEIDLSELDCVIDNEKIEFSLINDGTHDAKISIFWEKCGYKKYRNLGLYGQMSVLYQYVYRPSGKPRTLIISGDKYVVILNT